MPRHSADIELAERNATTAIATFIRLDRVGALGGVLFVIAANLIFVRQTVIWIVLPFLVGLLVVLTFAARRVARGEVLASLVLVAAGNWSIALVVSVMFPFLWPVMVLTVLMPIVLATPHVEGTQLALTIGAGALVSSSVGAFGLLTDGLVDVGESLQVVLIVGALAAQSAPIGLIVWQIGDLQRTSLERVSALNLDLIRSEAALAASRRRVVDSADDVRQRIERDLHDGAQQRLVALGIRLRLLEQQTLSDAKTHTLVTSLVGDLDGAVDELRSLAHGIYPPLLEARGLAVALGAVSRQSPLNLELDVEPVGRHGSSIESAVYFMCLEALANVAKHAPHARVKLTLAIRDRHLAVSVADDGPGFDLSTTPVSKGLANMGDRIAVVGGGLVIDSTPGGGVAISARVPIDHPVPAMERSVHERR